MVGENNVAGLISSHFTLSYPAKYEWSTRADETVRLLEKYGDDAADISTWSTSNDVDGPR